MIEGTYEQRESTNLDDPINNKYGGVSARLFQDGGAGGTDAVLSLSPTGNAEDDPYEKLGRCNSFTPKTRAEKSKEMIKVKERKRKEDEDDENDNSDHVDNKQDPENQETPTARKKSDDPNPVPNDNDSVDLPFVGEKTNIKPMEMNSFKPGASIRKKQQRTSMKKPNKGANGEDRNKLSETHEDVKITPLPLKKNFAKNHTLKGDGSDGFGSAFSSCEKIPDTVDSGKQSPVPSSDTTNSDNKSLSPQASVDGDDKKDSVEAKIDNNDGKDEIGTTTNDSSSNENDDENSPNKNTKPEPTMYADIEIIKQNGDKGKDDDKTQNGDVDSLKHGTPSLNGDVTTNGIYTDVIIADD